MIESSIIDLKPCAKPFGMYTDLLFLSFKTTDIDLKKHSIYLTITKSGKHRYVYLSKKTLAVLNEYLKLRLV